MGIGVPVLPRPMQREFEFPGIKVAAHLAAGSERGTGPRPVAGDGRKPQAPAAGDGRARNKWLGSRGHDPAGPTFPPRGGRKARWRRGTRGGKARCAALGTVCGEALRRASGSARCRVCPYGPPARALATAASRRGREGSAAARRPLRRPLGRSAGCWPLAGCNFKRSRRAPNVPKLCTPALHARGLRAPPLQAQRPAAVGRVSSLSTAPAARAQFSGAAAAAQVRDQLSLASSAPLVPATQTPPPDAPSLTSRPAQLPPAGSRLAAHPTTRWAAGIPAPSPPALTRCGPPGAARSRAGRSGHEYFSTGEAALCRCHGTGCCGNSTNPPKGQGGSPRKRPQVRAGAVPRRATRGPGEGPAEGWGPGQPPVRSAPLAERGNDPGKPGPASRRMS